MPYTARYLKLRNSVRPFRPPTVPGYSYLLEDRNSILYRWKEAAIVENKEREARKARKAREAVHLAAKEMPTHTGDYINHDWIAQLPPPMIPVESVSNFEDEDEVFSPSPSADTGAIPWAAIAMVCLLVGLFLIS